MTATQTGVPTGTAGAAILNPTPGPGNPCAEFSGAGFGFCTAFCSLSCDTDPRFPCGVIDRLFRHFTGDMTPPSCQQPTTAQTPSVTACSGLTGRAAGLCQRICAHCSTTEFASSCLRLRRQFGRITGGATLSC
jgi:hypothetical protein